ncbi:hypothetical protein CMI40_02325 [Candidatus Pacearchaeota archaeon]|jgi:ribosomal protein S15P/S13E|nr:hypothetical protein [Candidatus Pacearchaeota archaeon]|tara:strand:+ start:6008 stop:6367 length:360 start_codon:yes stop_codon:yes gene_type:complete
MPKKLKNKKKDSDKKDTKSKKISQLDFEKKIIELSKKGLTSEKIGEELRQQKIHPKEYNKKISQILGDKYVNPDLKNIKEKLERVKKHSEKNKQDKRAKREKDRIFSQLRKFKKYFKVE